MTDPEETMEDVEKIRAEEKEMSLVLTDNKQENTERETTQEVGTFESI